MGTEDPTLGAKIIPFPLRGDVTMSDGERDAVLLAADELIAKGGRDLLAQVLKGIHSEVVLAAEAEKTKGFASLVSLSLAQIEAMIDKLLADDLLRIESYLGRPLLVHSPSGWERTKDLLAARIVTRLRERAAAGDAKGTYGELARIHREVKLLVLERAGSSGDARLAPVLEAWRERETKPMKRRIGEVLDRLTCASPSSSPR